MPTALESAPTTLALDTKTVLDLVPHKALLLAGPTNKPLTERVRIRVRRFVKPLFRYFGLMKPKPSDFRLTHEIPPIFGPGTLELDKSCEIVSDEADVRQVANNTRNQYWIKSVDGQSITGNHFTSADPSTQPLLQWKNPVVSPAYRYRGCTDTEGLISVLPASLLIKPTPAYEKKTRQLDKLLATHFGLIYQPDISRYLAGFRYYLIETPRKGQLPRYNAYQAWQRIHEPQYHQFVKFCELELVPYCVPTANNTGPNDPYYDGRAGTQWNLSWIKAEEGWARAGWRVDNSTFEPGKNVVVAVIDSGIDLKHPDFEARSAFVPGATFQPGADFDYEAGEGPVEIDDDPETGGGESDDPHGTYCAGLIGARSNNNLGIAGLAGSCKIMPIAINGYYTSTVAAAINWAAQHDADVISMSFGGDARNRDFLKGSVMDAAIENAYEGKKVVLCAATMNQNEPQLYYPASHPNVLACGASGYMQDTRSTGEWPVSVGPGANFGPELDVVAPGTRVSTVVPMSRNSGTPYATGFSGTSAATPQVAGLAALLISAYPDKLRHNPSEVYRVIRESARAVRQSGTRDNEVGYGCIDVLEAFITAEKNYGRPTWPNFST